MNKEVIEKMKVACANIVTFCKRNPPSDGVNNIEGLKHLQEAMQYIAETVALLEQEKPERIEHSQTCGCVMCRDLSMVKIPCDCQQPAETEEYPEMPKLVPMLKKIYISASNGNGLIGWVFLKIACDIINRLAAEKEKLKDRLLIEQETVAAFKKEWELAEKENAKLKKLLELYRKKRMNDGGGNGRVFDAHKYRIAEEAIEIAEQALKGR